MSKLGATIILVLLVVVGIVVLVQQGRHDDGADFDWIVTELVDKGHYREAVTELESLRDTADAGLADRVEQQLARAYVGVGNDPGMSHEQRMQWYRRAYEIDPDALDDLPRQMVQREREGEGAR